MPCSKDDSRPEPPWYKDGLRFTCTECGQCCTGKPGFVWLSNDEMNLIAAHLKIDSAEFRAKYITNTHAGYSLIERPNFDCILLVRRKCSVYEVRPKQCRTWPFWRQNLYSPQTWEGEARTCPGMGKGRLYTFVEIEQIARGERNT